MTADELYEGGLSTGTVDHLSSPMWMLFGNDEGHSPTSGFAPAPASGGVWDKPRDNDGQYTIPDERFHLAFTRVVEERSG
jgi:hypothetical protein